MGRSSEHPMLAVSSECTGCGACLATCPEDAVVVSGARIAVDHLRCTACFECVEVCPAGAINPSLGIGAA